ncbi:hypothetical protein ACNAN0_05325 [Agrilactobacillus fermenti]|uniref:hypothetical protein n=1 Tax=Agrilactobacillus fermenti TaxID=2586909 RepID=UPI003A5C7370
MTITGINGIAPNDEHAVFDVKDGDKITLKASTQNNTGPATLIGATGMLPLPKTLSVATADLKNGITIVKATQSAEQLAGSDVVVLPLYLNGDSTKANDLARRPEDANGNPIGDTGQTGSNTVTLTYHGYDGAKITASDYGIQVDNSGYAQTTTHYYVYDKSSQFLGSYGSYFLDTSVEDAPLAPNNIAFSTGDYANEIANYVPISNNTYLSEKPVTATPKVTWITTPADTDKYLWLKAEVPNQTTGQLTSARIGELALTLKVFLPDDAHTTYTLTGQSSTSATFYEYPKKSPDGDPSSNETMMGVFKIPNIRVKGGTAEFLKRGAGVKVMTLEDKVNHKTYQVGDSNQVVHNIPTQVVKLMAPPMPDRWTVRYYTDNTGAMGSEQTVDPYGTIAQRTLNTNFAEIIAHNVRSEGSVLGPTEYINATSQVVKLSKDSDGVLHGKGAAVHIGQYDNTEPLPLIKDDLRFRVGDKMQIVFSYPKDTYQYQAVQSIDADGMHASYGKVSNQTAAMNPHYDLEKQSDLTDHDEIYHDMTMKSAPTFNFAGGIKLQVPTKMAFGKHLTTETRYLPVQTWHLDLTVTDTAFNPWTLSAELTGPFKNDNNQAVHSGEQLALFYNDVALQSGQSQQIYKSGTVGPNDYGLPIVTDLSELSDTNQWTSASNQDQPINATSNRPTGPYITRVDPTQEYKIGHYTGGVNWQVIQSIN